MSNDLTQEIAEKIAEEIVKDKPYNPNALLSPSLEKQKALLEVKQELDDVFNKITKGTELLLTRLTILEEKQPDLLNEKIKGELEHLGQQADAPLVNETEPFNFKEAFALSDETLSVCQHAAIDYYNHQEYLEAGDVFFILSVLNPADPFVWMGLGNAYYFSNQFEKAITIYEICEQLDPEDPLFNLHAAHCFDELSQHSSAIENIKKALEKIQANPQYSELESNAQTFLQELQSK